MAPRRHGVAGPPERVRRALRRRRRLARPPRPAYLPFRKSRPRGLTCPARTGAGKAARRASALRPVATVWLRRLRMGRGPLQPAVAVVSTLSTPSSPRPPHFIRPGTAEHGRPQPLSLNSITLVPAARGVRLRRAHPAHFPRACLADSYTYTPPPLYISATCLAPQSAELVCLGIRGIAMASRSLADR